jgi:hypothetical protein
MVELLLDIQLNLSSMKKVVQWLRGILRHSVYATTNFFDKIPRANSGGILEFSNCFIKLIKIMQNKKAKIINPCDSFQIMQKGEFNVLN